MRETQKRYKVYLYLFCQPFFEEPQARFSKGFPNINSFVLFFLGTLGQVRTPG